MTTVRTRDGDLVEVAEHDCEQGWVESVTGAVRPCAVCRPDTIERLRRQRERSARSWIPVEAMSRAWGRPA